MKNNSNDDYVEEKEEDIYAAFNQAEEVKEEDNVEEKTDPVKDENGYKEKNYNNNYLEEHTVVTKASKASKFILYGFYLLVVLIGVVIFFMLRADRYEFYLVKDEISINSGSTYQIELTPKNVRYFDYLNYKYEVEDTSIAKVDEFGTVTALGGGTTNLTISLSPGLISKTMRIKCDDKEITSISLLVYNNDKLLDGNNATMKINETITLRAIGNNDKNLNLSVKYSSSNTKVATVDDFGNVTANAEGSATISGTKDGVVGQFIVTVIKNTSTTTPTTPTSTPTPTKTPTPAKTPTPNASSGSTITKVELSTTRLTKYVGDTVMLSAKIIPTTAKAKSITWASSDTSIATVTQQGLVKAKKKGTTTIVVTADGVKASCTITVREKEAAQPTTTSTPTVNAPSGSQSTASAVKLSKTSLTVDKGKTATFDVSVTNALGVMVVKSTNTSVVTVKPTKISSPNETVSDNCHGDNCYFDKWTITYTVTGVAAGTAYIDVSVKNYLTLYDGSSITGSGKVGILVK